MADQDVSARQENHGESHGPKYHLWAFSVSIVLTLLAFWAVGSNEIALAFTIPFILILAVVQAAFQLYVWMHLKDKGHDLPALFMYSGLLIAVITVAALMLLIWW